MPPGTNFYDRPPLINVQDALAIMYHGSVTNLSQFKYSGLVDGYSRARENIGRDNVTEMVKSTVYASENCMIKKKTDEELHEVLHKILRARIPYHIEDLTVIEDPE